MTTVTGIVEAASVMFVAVTTGSEARPSTTAKVLWLGGATQPTNMADGDIWFRVPTTGPIAPLITTTTLNTLTQGVSFTQSLEVSGTAPFTFSISAGSLPAGLSLNASTGVITGTPSAAGSYSFTVQATNVVAADTQAFSGTVSASAVVPTITTTTLTSLTQGTSFSQTLAATGTSPLTWTISAGTLPAGLTLNSSTGAITGTPTGSGAYSFTVQATNTAGNDTQAYSGTIATGGTAPTITTTTLNALQEGVSFSQTLARTGSTPITWGVSAGTMPSGLTINSSTGVISGTPAAGTAGAYSFTVQATNSFGNDTQAYSGTIDPSADEDTYSVFGATVPASLTSHSDAVAGDWLTHTFYWSGSSVPSGAQVIGARLYVPAGSAHIGQGWFAAIQTSSGGFYPGLGTFPHTNFDSNGTKIAGDTLVEGWNEVLFASPVAIPAVGGGWYIGTQIGNGSRYLYNNTLNSSSIESIEHDDFYLAETTTSLISRHFYNNSTGSPVRWYGIDTIIEIP